MPMVFPRFSPSSFNGIYCLFGARQEEEGKQSQAQGPSTEQHLPWASIGLLVVERTGLGPPWVLLRSLVRDTSGFLCPSCSEQKVRSKSQAMGWFVDCKCGQEVTRRKTGQVGIGEMLCVFHLV